jgi:hypothetical protein
MTLDDRQGPPASRTNRDDARTGKSSQLRLVRKTASVAMELAGADTGRREMLAALLGLRRAAAADPVALVVALHEADASAAMPITALLGIAENNDPIDAVVAAVELAEDRERGKSVWTVLTALREVAGPLPTVPAKAGGAIAKAAKTLNQYSLTELRALRELLR